MKTKCLASVFASGLMAVQVLGQSPSIKFTFVPQLDDTDVAICTVTNVDRTVYGVCFILDFQNTKWTKPNSQYPISLIGSNNTAGVLLAWWNGADTYADKIYAFVVPLVYSNSIPFLAGQGSIPLEIYSNSIAYAVADRGSTNDYIGFSGMVWQKKETGPFTWGPGPNYFSGNSNNVFVDGNGRLHLRITNRNGTWYCPEIMLTNSLGYGIYRFHVDSDVSTMSTQVVLGTFTYSDDTDYAHREIDVESSGGPVVGNGTINTWQHVVQPWSYGGHRFQFAPPANMNKSVHQFLWMEDRVLFNSFTNYATDSWSYNFYGTSSMDFVGDDWQLAMYQQVLGPTNAIIDVPGYTALPGKFFIRAELTGMSGDPLPFATTAIERGWVTIPKPGNEVVHINLWLSGTNGLALDQTNEVVISSFEFVPISQVPRPSIGIHSISPLSLRFKFPAD